MIARLAPVALLLFFSGACALVFQVAWLREFRLVFGGSTAASAAVLAAFMGGLGVGNAVLGRMADRWKHPLLLYGYLELLIAISCAATPFLIDFSRGIYISLGGQLSLGVTGAAVTRLFLTAIVLGIPTILMGGTLPAATRAAISNHDRNRRAVGWLYGLNTLGAVLGTMVSTFVLLEWLGTRATLWSACAVNLALAIAAVLLAKTAMFSSENRKSETETSKSNEPAGSETTQSTVTTPRWEARFVYACCAFVGCAFFLMELVWYRILTPLLGGTTFSFGLILATALAGVGMGGIVYGALARHRHPTWLTFSMICGLEALFIAIPFALGDRVAIWALYLQDPGDYAFLGRVAGWAVVTVIVVMPAALVSGVQFPLLISLLGSGRQAVGRQVGFAFAANTTGAIVGSLAGGFGFLPTLSAPGTWKLVVVSLLALSLVSGMISFTASTRRWFRWFPFAFIPVAGLLMYFPGPTAVWRHSRISAGAKILVGEDAKNLEGFRRHQRRCIIWEADGVESSVALAAIDGLAFVVDGKTDGNSIGDASTQMMLGLLPALWHSSPKNAFVIGLGTGETAGWLAKCPGMKSVDVAELEPAIREVAMRCALANHDVLSQSNVRVIYNDAREVLLTIESRYDLVVSEPSNPYRAGIANLFTREFYQAVSGRLNEGGIFAQWVQGYEISEQTFQVILQTLRSEFSHVEIWHTNPRDFVLLCSGKEIDHDLPALRGKIEREPFRTALARAWRVVDVEGILAHHIAGSSYVDDYCKQHALGLNTDNRNIVEYGFARTFGRSSTMTPELLRRDVMGSEWKADWGKEGTVDPVDVMNRLLELYAFRNQSPTFLEGLDQRQVRRFRALQNAFLGEVELAIAEWEEQTPDSSQTLSPIELLTMSLAYLTVDPSKSLLHAEQLRHTFPAEARFLIAIAQYQLDNTAEATQQLPEAFLYLRNDPWVYSEVLHTGFALANQMVQRDPSLAGEFVEVFSQPFGLYCKEDYRRMTHFAMATLLDDPQPAVDAVTALEPNVPMQEFFLRARIETYRRANHPLLNQAVDDLKQFWETRY